MKGDVVYFARCLRFVKIGYSANGLKGAMERLEAFRTGNPFPVSMLWVVMSGRYTEGFLHQHFAQYAVTREWFRLSGELLVFIRRGMAAKAAYLDWRSDGPRWNPESARHERRVNEHNTEYVRLRRLEDALKERLSRVQRKRVGPPPQTDGWAPSHGEWPRPPAKRSGETRFDRDGRMWAGRQRREEEVALKRASDVADGERIAETRRELLGPTGGP